MRRSWLYRLFVALVSVCTLSACSPESEYLITQPIISLPPLLPAGAAFLGTAALESNTPTECSGTLPLRPYPANHVPLPGGRLERILLRGRLIVGLDQGTFPFSYRDTASGEMKGFDVAMAQELARGILGDPSRVEFRIISSAGRLTALRDDLVDVVVKTMSITCDRADYVSFSEPYFETDQRVMAATNTNASSFTDRKILGESTVCAARGSTSAILFHRVFPTASILGTTTWADCLVAIQQGSVDAITSDESILFGFYDQDPNLYFLSALQLGHQQYGMGVHKGDVELQRLVNAIVEKVKNDGTWSSLCTKILKFSPCNRPPATPRYAPEEPPAP